jgi:hypothetical protein
MCGKEAKADRQIIERIDGVDYIFDRSECAVTFKKLRSVYGTDFCVSLNA